VTVLIDAETRQRVDVLAGRTAEPLKAWLRDHPCVQVVCREGSGAYAEAIRQALSGAVQVGDRWHLWHGVAGAVLKEVTAHSSCWAAAGPPLKQGKWAQTTAERWRRVHDLLGRGTGLLEFCRRPGLSPNSIKRCARAAEPERMIRAPGYRPTLAGPYRDHLRARRAADPAVRVQTLLAEIRELGYSGSMNLLYRHFTQGRVEADQQHLSSKSPGSCSPGQTPLSDDQQALLGKLTAACLQMTDLAELVRFFAALLTPDAANQAKLGEWIQAAKASDLPNVHSFTCGLDLDMDAAIAAVTLAIS